jgi:hypothetical protein
VGILLFPDVEGRFADAHLAADIGDRTAAFDLALYLGNLFLADL